MSAPSRRVLSLSVTSRRRPVQNALDPAAHPARRFRLLGPDRLHNPRDERRVDRLTRQLAERRIDVGGERRRPLRRVLRIAPPRLVRGDVGIRAFGKRHRLRRIEFRLRSLGPSRLDRIYAAEPQLAALARPVTCFCQGDRVRRAETHDTEPIGLFESEDPAFCAALAHLKEQPTAITVQSAAPRLAHRQTSQLPDEPHCPAHLRTVRRTHLAYPSTYP